MRVYRLVLAAVAVVALAALLSSGSLAGRGKQPKPKPTANPEIAYNYRDAYGEGVSGELKVMAADGSNVTTVFKFTDSRWLAYPTWSPDGPAAANIRSNTSSATRCARKII